MEFIPFAAALALAWKLIDLLKFIQAKDWNATITQVSVWVAGVLVISLTSLTDWASGIEVGDLTLDAMNGASLLLVGLSLGSTGSVLYDFKKAVDRSDSAKTPPLTGSHA